MAGNGAQVRLVTEAGLISAKVVKVDAANDLALLKAEGKFAPLPVVSSRAVKMGSTVATVGFPNIGLQGFAPKLAKGEIAALSGAQDDPRYFQISVPVQPGNSGGALVDERGNVVGVVAAKLMRRQPLGDQRGAAGERELRRQEQPPAQLPRIRAGSVCQAQGAERRRPKVRGRGKICRKSRRAGVGVLNTHPRSAQVHAGAQKRNSYQFEARRLRLRLVLRRA